MVIQNEPVASSSAAKVHELPKRTATPASTSPRVPSLKGKERAEIHETSTANNERGQAVVQGADNGPSGTEDDEDMDELDYERERQRRIEENRLLLDSLGFSALQPSASSSSLVPRTTQPGSPHRKKRQKVSAPVYDRSGHVLSLPRAGEIHIMTCVEISSDRRLKKRIAEGEYADCTHWAEGEARRWKYGWGKGGEGEDEEEYEGGISERFRWRKWKGLEKELRRELTRRGEMNDADQGGDAAVAVVGPIQAALRVEGEPSAYSLIPGLSCHQCRRKSDKLKMTCRNLSPECRAVFCETCCKRYSYFDFDPDSRTFICPLCKDCCNCSNCIRKRNLAHLLDGRKGVNRRLLQAGNKGDSGIVTIQDALEKAVEGKVGLPFDLVRIVTQAEDVISPDLPEEVVEVMTKKSRGRKKKKEKKRELDDGVPRRKSGRKSLAEKELERTSGEAENGASKPLLIKIRLPKLNADVRLTLSNRVKEVDSDGDTVGGYSSDDAKSSTSSSSSRASRSPGRRLPFPPRPLGLPPPALSTNDYLSSLARMDQLLGYTDTDLTHPSFHYSPLQPSSTGIYGLDDITPTSREEVPIHPNLLHPDPTMPWRSHSAGSQDTPIPSTTATQPSSTRIRLRIPQQQQQPTPQYSYTSSPNPTFLPDLTDLTLPSLSNTYDDHISTVPGPSSPNLSVGPDHRAYLSPRKARYPLNNTNLVPSPPTPHPDISHTESPYETTPYPWTIPGLHDPPPYSHSPPSRNGGSIYQTLPVPTLTGFNSRTVLNYNHAAPPPVLEMEGSASSDLGPRNAPVNGENVMSTGKTALTASSLLPAGSTTMTADTMARTSSQRSQPEEQYDSGPATMGQNELGLEMWHDDTLYGPPRNGGSMTSVSGLVGRRYHPDHL